VVEIGSDTIRWHGGWRRRDRLVVRVQVAAVRVGRDARFLKIEFSDLAGERVGRLPLAHFPAGQVFAALRR
jgi:hypothetical protein